MITETFKQGFCIPGISIPQEVTGSTLTTGPVNCALNGRAVFIGLVGALGTSATIDAYLQESAEANGANGVNIANSAITQITSAAGGLAFTQEVRADQLTAGKPYVTQKLVGGAGSDTYAAAVAIGMEPRFHPVTNLTAATVTQQIVVS